MCGEISDGSPVRTLIRSAYELEKAGSIGRAIERARQAIEQADCPDDQAAARVCLSYLLNHMGRFDEALALAEEAAGLEVGDARIRTGALMTRGICLTEFGRLEETEESLLEAMDLAREHGNRKALQKCLHVLSAGVYIPRGQFDLARASD